MGIDYNLDVKISEFERDLISEFRKMLRVGFGDIVIGVLILCTELADHWEERKN